MAGTVAGHLCMMSTKWPRSGKLPGLNAASDPSKSGPQIFDVNWRPGWKTVEVKCSVKMMNFCVMVGPQQSWKPSLHRTAANTQAPIGASAVPRSVSCGKSGSWNPPTWPRIFLRRKSKGTNWKHGMIEKPDKWSKVGSPTSFGTNPYDPMVSS